MSDARAYNPLGVGDQDDGWPDVPEEGWSSGTPVIPSTSDEVDRVAQEVGREAVRRLLNAMGASPSRAVRRRAFDRLVERGAEAGPEAAERLGQPGQPWYVIRNLLALLGALPEMPRGWSPSLYARHPHPAVRLEALRLLVRIPSRREWAMCRLLEEEDPKAVAVGLAAAQQDPPTDALPLLLGLAVDPELSTELRRLAVRGLAATGAPEAKELLLSLATATPRWYDRRLRRTRLDKTCDVLPEAVSGLRAWSEDPDARRVLRRAAVDLDRTVRRAAGGAR